METTTQMRTAPRPDAWRALSDLSDDSLVQRAREHDLAAFEALMRRHNRRLFRVTRGVLRDSDDAQDAVQETYLRAFTRLETYQPAGKFPAWLTRIALNEALMMRRRSPAAMVSLDEAGNEAVAVQEATTSDAPSSDQFVEAAHARALLEHAIDALPENFRMVFVMRAVEGLDVRETAESLGINPNTVRTRLFRAQRLLRGELARRLQTESSEVFDFGAERCDAVVAGVFEKLAA
ncbi:MAG TPA: RNA polymerase sigma factor [Steroidobacteraceae bacterium]